MYFTSCYPLQQENEKNKPKFNAMIEKVFFLSLAVLSRCFEHCARVIWRQKRTNDAFRARRDSRVS